MKRLLVVGGGQMGSALAAGLLASSWAKPDELALVEVVAEMREALAARFPAVEVLASPEPAEAAVLAVKPGDVPAACASLGSGGYRRVLSIAAGVPLGRLEALLWPGATVLRCMPNTPATIGAGASALAGGSHVDDGDLDWAESVLSAIGTVVRLPEAQLDAVTGLSGSGPAYVFLVAEALVDAGVLAGLSREVATALANQTLLGSARLLAESGRPAAELRGAVTSPGGTTAAGLRVLERSGLRAAFLDAVAAATERSRALGGGN